MRRIQFLTLFLFVSFVAFGQRFHVGLFGGLAAYNGDLTEKILPKKVTNGAIGLSLNYELKDQLVLRGGLTYAIVGGADRFSEDPELVRRNLLSESWY